MSMESFRPALIAAAGAGLLAALVLTVLQWLWITPLILKAESFESGSETTELSHAAAGHDHTTHEHAAVVEQAHHHDHGDEWKPEDGLQRTLFTLAANIVMGFGYALLLATVFQLWRGPVSATQGLLFGLAGFIVFFAAPGLGLPPELPGTEAAELSARQHWWLATAVATAAGLALLFVQTTLWGRVLGVALLLAPHIVGAPHPAVPASVAPQALQTEFRIATTVGNALFWLLLGATCAGVLRRSPAPR